MKTTYKHQLKSLAFERIQLLREYYKETDHHKNKQLSKSFIRQELILIKQLR